MPSLLIMRCQQAFLALLTTKVLRSTVNLSLNSSYYLTLHTDIVSKRETSHYTTSVAQIRNLNWRYKHEKARSFWKQQTMCLESFAGEWRVQVNELKTKVSVELIDILPSFARTVGLVLWDLPGRSRFRLAGGEDALVLLKSCLISRAWNGSRGKVWQRLIKGEW